MAALLAACLLGCAGRDLRRWIDPDDVLMISSQDQIEAEFRRLFCGFGDGPKRFSIKEMTAGDARFAFVTAYPYRGPNVFGIYCFEQITRDTWHLRAVIPVIEAQDATPTFIWDGGPVKVVVDGRAILTVNSVAETMRRALDTSTRP
jgi:hypothetical protein